ITESAAAKIKELIDGRERDDLAVRVILRGRLPGGKFQTEFKFVGLDDLTETDIVQDTGLFKLYLDPNAAGSMQGAIVDFNESKYSSGFNIEYNSESYFPAGVKAKRDWTDPLAIAVQEVIDTHINPGVSAHGGWVLLLDVKDDQAHVEMGGGCQGCGAAAMTLRQGIETSIMEMVPGIKGIVDVTDHGEGENPYYAADAVGATPFDSPPTPTAE
ncbi:MAG: NifU family protein, partial [Chloroflexi bacterium]|nr:NifU family protein [Chloroflexota bacterium]